MAVDNSAFRTQHSHNYALDFLKGLACIGVVFIHIKFPGLFGTIVRRASDFAVPVFFMISGFYAYKADSATIIKRMRRVICIMLCTVAIYAISLLPHYDRIAGVFTFTVSSVLRAAIRLVLLSDFDFIFGGHLWFLMSLVEAYIILLAVKKYGLTKVAYMYIIFAMFATEGVSALSPDDWHLTCNVFMFGFPWVMAGHYIAENLPSFSRIGRKTLYASAIVGCLLRILVSTGQLMFLGHFMFIANVGFNLFPASLFILAIREDSQTVKFPPSIVKIGAEYSLYVYISHLLVARIYMSVLQQLGVPDDMSLVMWTTPVIVLILSLLVSFVIVRVRDRISRKKSW